MTVRMANTSDLSPSERVQRLYTKNVELENRRRKATQARIPSDPSAWQQMRDNYEAIVLEDHAFSEQHEVEFSLWQLHYRRIDELRAQLSAALPTTGSTAAQNGKGSTRPGPDRITKIRSHFKTFLSEATGFYHDLMVKIKANYGLPLGYLSDDQENQILSQDRNISAEVKKGLISCHRCLIYLGDLARYKGLYGEGKSKARDFAAASSYYMQASSLWPSSGNPHHQLAILASYSGDELAAIYQYFRSLAVDNPFTTARDNLIIAFEKLFLVGNMWGISVNVVMLIPLKCWSSISFFFLFLVFVLHIFCRKYEVPSDLCTVSSHCSNHIAIMCFGERVFYNRRSYSHLSGEAKASAKMVPVRLSGKGRGKGETRVARDNRVEASVKERVTSIPETFKFFSLRFIRLNGILFTRTSLETFGELYSVVKSDLLELLASGPDEVYNFGSDAAECRLVIIRLIAIFIFTIHNLNRETENQSYAEILQRSLLLQNAFSAIFELMGHILERCIQLNDPSISFLLPGIMVFVEWLACREDIAVGNEVEEKQANARSFFWNHCVTLFNKLLSSGFSSINEDEDETCFFKMGSYDEGETANWLALFEDFELRGFLPLVPAQLILDFSRKHALGSDGSSKGKTARVQRIIAAGKVLANVIHVGQMRFYFDPKLKTFNIGIEPQMSDDYLFSSSLEIPRSNGIEQGILAESQLNLELLQPMPQLYMELEEEDEVIVFKPPLSEKHANGFVSKLSASQVLGSGVNTSKVDFESYMGSVSASNDGFLLQNALNTSSMPTSLANTTAQYLQRIQPNTSMWLAEQVSVNELSNLHLTENGFPMKHELDDRLGSLQPTALSVLFPHQSVNLSVGNKYPFQVPEPAVPSKFDSVMSSGTVVDSVSTKPSSIMPAVLRKNPVSRPPPGFNSVPPKLADDYLSGVALKNENPPKDDYCWLDGYQLTSSTLSSGFNNSINQSANGYHPVSSINSLTEIVSFPFPGKQVATLQVQAEKQKGWQDHQFSERVNLFQEQQQQLQKGSQQSFAVPEQFQGQTLLEDHFFV